MSWVERCVGFIDNHLLSKIVDGDPRASRCVLSHFFQNVKFDKDQICVFPGTPDLDAVHDAMVRGCLREFGRMIESKQMQKFPLLWQNRITLFDVERYDSESKMLIGSGETLALGACAVHLSECTCLSCNSALCVVLPSDQAPLQRAAFPLALALLWMWHCWVQNHLRDREMWQQLLECSECARKWISLVIPLSSAETSEGTVFDIPWKTYPRLISAISQPVQVNSKVNIFPRALEYFRMLFPHAFTSCDLKSSVQLEGLTTEEQDEQSEDLDDDDYEIAHQKLTDLPRLRQAGYKHANKT